MQLDDVLEGFLMSYSTPRINTVVHHQQSADIFCLMKRQPSVLTDEPEDYKYFAALQVDDNVGAVKTRPRGGLFDVWARSESSC